MTTKQKKIKENEQTSLASIEKIGHRDMTSLEIAEFTGKMHKGILRDIRAMQEEIGTFTVNGDGVKVVPSSYVNSQNKKQPMLKLDAVTSLTLLTGYYPTLRYALISRWRLLEKRESDHNAISSNSKEIYKHLMDAVLLDVEDKKESAMKVATIVNKATSNYFGFAKMVKMKDMSDEMLLIRMKILEDYNKTFELFQGTDMKVKEFIYKKWSQKLLDY